MRIGNLRGNELDKNLQNRINLAKVEVDETQGGGERKKIENKVVKLNFTNNGHIFNKRVTSTLAENGTRTISYRYWQNRGKTRTKFKKNCKTINECIITYER
uniref:Uncharacterized protein n=1 Tax=viral metagenome TaxID=1070528 RepID=A0A6C0ECQ5_9ZZZZ